MAKALKSVAREAGRQKPAFVWNNPGVIYDRFGLSVDTRGDVWELTDPSRKRVCDWRKCHCDKNVEESLKSYIANSVEVKSSHTAANAFHYLVEDKLNDALDDFPVSLNSLLSLLQRYREIGQEWRFHWVRRWYLWCADVDIPGFSLEIADDLMEYRVGGNEKGVAVLTDDDEFGPLDNVELNLVRSALERGVGSLVERVCVMLCMELGANPKNFVLLEERDFKKHEHEDGQFFYMLQVPRIKKRLDKRSVRHRKISKVLGGMLEALVEHNAEIHERTYGDKSPLLVREEGRRRLFGSKSLKRFEYHMSTSDFLQCVRRYPEIAGLNSPRTVLPLNLNPRRFRYTFATRLVEQGAPPAVVADALDHTDLQHVGVYYEARGKTVEALDNALGGNSHYLDVINRFMGSIVERDTSSLPVVPGDAPTYRSLGGIGYCGSTELCKVYPPLSCYLCPSFQAWRDGPHEEMLAELKASAREFASLSGYPVPRISNQVDDVILAIEQLVRLLLEDDCA